MPEGFSQFRTESNFHHLGLTVLKQAKLSAQFGVLSGPPSSLSSLSNDVGNSKSMIQGVAVRYNHYICTSHWVTLKVLIYFINVLNINKKQFSVLFQCTCKSILYIVSTLQSLSSHSIYTGFHTGIKYHGYSSNITDISYKHSSCILKMHIINLVAAQLLLYIKKLLHLIHIYSIYMSAAQL